MKTQPTTDLLQLALQANRRATSRIAQELARYYTLEKLTEGEC